MRARRRQDQNKLGRVESETLDVWSGEKTLLLLFLFSKVLPITKI